MPTEKRNDRSQNYSYTLTFDNKEQYDLFMDYLRQTKINRGISPMKRPNL